MGFFLVVKAEIVYRFIVMRRYWFATIMGIIVGYGMLMALIVGFLTRRDEVTDAIQSRFVSVDPERATSVALGFIIGMYAFGIVGMFSQGLQGMARTGQLEQLCLSPHGLITNFFARSLVSSISTVLMSSIMLAMIAQTVQGRLHVQFGPLIILLALTYANLIGFGFMVGGLVLVFKQTGNIAVLIRMGLLALAVWAPDRVDQSGTGSRAVDWFLHVLPITDAAICIKHVLIKGQMIPVFNEAGEIVGTEFKSVFFEPSFWFLAVSCVLWTTIGISVFKVMENWSRDKGTLGAY